MFDPASTLANHSTISSPMGFFPGGPSPDSPLPLHSKPIDTRHQAAVITVDTETYHQGDEMMALPRQEPATRELSSDLPPQPSEHTTTSTRGHPFPDDHPENAPAVRVAAAPNGEAAEGLLGKEAARSASLATRRTNRSLHTNGMGAERASATDTATAANGPSEVDPGLQARATSVDEEPKQMAIIGKEEHGVSRKLSKFEKRGAKTEKAALQVALKELAEIQGLQTGSIKDEAVFHSRHSRALSDAHKAEMELLAARTENERAQASLRAAGEVLETSRRHSRETTKMLQEKMEEVESLRIHKKVNDKERAVKRPIGHRLGRILGSE